MHQITIIAADIWCEQIHITCYADYVRSLGTCYPKIKARYYESLHGGVSKLVGSREKQRRLWGRREQQKGGRKQQLCTWTTLFGTFLWNYSTIATAGIKLSTVTFIKDEISHDFEFLCLFLGWMYYLRIQFLTEHFRLTNQLERARKIQCQNHDSISLGFRSWPSPASYAYVD